MGVSFPTLWVGNPSRYQSLAVFPLFAEPIRPVDYVLSDEAISTGRTVVQECGEQGAVNELVVDNRADKLVLFLEGEELQGAKQNRVLNTSVLVPPQSRLRIPVSCVEQGRWRYTSQEFSSGLTMSPSKLRYSLKSSVSLSLRRNMGHSSDQSSVWSEVQRQQKALQVTSATAALSDTIAVNLQHVARFAAALKYVEGCTGMAVALGPKVLSVDLFNQPATCCEVWSRFLSGFALDALENWKTDGQVERCVIEELLRASLGAEWQNAKAVGAGEEYRSDDFAGNYGSILSYGASLIHLSIVMAG